MPPLITLAAAALLGGAAWGCLVPRPGGAPVVLIASILVGWGAFAARHASIALAACGGALVLSGLLLAADADRNAREPPLRRDLAQHLARPPAGSLPVWIEGRLRSDAEATDFGAAALVDVAALREEGSGAWRTTAGGVRVSIGGALIAGQVPSLSLGRVIRVPVVAHRPQRYRNPGVPDQELALARRGLILFASAKSGALVEIVGPATLVEEWAAAARRRARRAISSATRGGDPQAVAVVQAIVIGDRAGLDPGVQDRLQRAGTFHVIAISGGNIAIVAGAFMWSLRRLRVPPASKAVACAAGVLAYGKCVLGGASVDRAVTVAALYFAARAFDLRASPGALLGAAAALGLIAEPLVLFDPGFALTFGATAGILVGVPRLLRMAGPLDPRGARPAGWLARSWLGLGAATVSAELALLPIGAWAFSRVSFAGLALNFLAVPLMTVAQVAGMAGAALDAVSEGLARAAGALAVLAANGLLESARFADLFPGASWRVPRPPVAAVITYYAAWGLALCCARRGVRAGSLLAGAAALAWILLAPAWPASTSLDGLGRPRNAGPWPASARVLSVTALDVGQGDATIVRFPSGEAWLVDAGGIPRSAFDVGARVVAPAAWALGVRRLASLVVTHGHPDHIGGAPSIAEAFAPGSLREGVAVAGHAGLDALRQATRRAGGRWEAVRRGLVLAGEVEVRVAHPAAADRTRREVSNDDSVVLDLRYGRASIVLPGDIGRLVEAGVAAQIAPAPLRVLKAPHHGSANSSTAHWIAALRPGAAVVSAGAGNRYNHPGRAALDRYAAHGVPVFRTDRDGAVAIETDGATVVVRSWSGRLLRLR